MSKTAIESITRTCSELGELEFGGIRLEDANPALLDVSQLDFDTHVKIQPGAIAYYAFLKKESFRRLTYLRRSFERWEKKKYAEAKASLGQGTGKSTVADIEARYIVDNDAEIEKWDALIEEAQAVFDTLDSWYEGWRQKSFTIPVYGGIEEVERFNVSSSMAAGENQNRPGRSVSTNGERINNIRTMIRQRREGKD